jgi:hypothetical protein
MISLIIRGGPLVLQGNGWGRFLVPQARPGISAGKVSGGKKGKIFRFPGLNVVLLTGVRGADLRFLEKPQAIKGGVGKVA